MRRIDYRFFVLFPLIASFLLIIFGDSSVFAEQLNLDESSTLVAANNEIDYRINALNKVYFWEPCPPSSGGSSGNSSSYACGQKLTAADAKSRLREAVEKFGGFTMDMQVKYGVPWEAVFFHMYGESQMGVSGLAVEVEKCGYYNTMGYVYSASSLYGITEEQMGNCAPHHGDNGALAAQFPSYEDMIMSYYTDYVRNGLYDSAFSYLNYKKYDLEGFLKTESDIYSAAGWDGRVAGYGAYKDVWYSIKDTIYDVAKKKGWPTSAELAKQKKIPVGGEYPVKGDIKKQLNAEPHSLSACDGSGGLTGDDDSDDDTSGEKISDDEGDSNSKAKSKSKSKSKSKTKTNDEDDDSDDDDSGSVAKGTSFPIDPNTPPDTGDFGGYWFFEMDWGRQPDSTPVSRFFAGDKSVLDEDFAHIPYIYADNYDISREWPYSVKPNGGKSKRKYYLITMPDRALATREGDKYIAYFENRKEPVYFVTYDVWSCNDQPGKGVNYCHDSENNPDDVVFGQYILGFPGVDNVSYNEMRVLAPKLGKLTCLHRLNDDIKPLVPESGKCSGAICNPVSSAKKKGKYPEHIQQTGHTCGPASMSMLATVAAGKEVSESDVISIIGGDSRAYVNTGGAGMTALDKKVGDKYGFDVENVSYSSFDDAEKKMKSYLDKGYMLHFSGAGSYPFTGGGHYIGVFGWSDKDAGKVMIADSNKGNAELKLHDVIHAGLHYDFSVIKGDGDDVSVCDDNDENTDCPSGDENDEGNKYGNLGTCSAKALSSVDKIIKLAKKNGYQYVYGGMRSVKEFNDILNNNAAVHVDCTGFASLVMYDAFGSEQIFTSYDNLGPPNFVEVSKSDVEPGDVFAYNSGNNCKPHGGIVVEIKNGLVTKIAQTGRPNYNGYNMIDGAIDPIGDEKGKKSLGIFEDPSGQNSNLGCLNGNATDLKFYRYKGCK